MNPYTNDTQRLMPLTTRVDYQQAMESLEDDNKWYKRENSARAILRIIFIGAFVFMFAAFVVAFTVLGVVSLIIESGMRWYVSLAPLALAVVIGYIYRGKRQ